MLVANNIITNDDGFAFSGPRSLLVLHVRKIRLDKSRVEELCKNERSLNNNTQQ